MTYELRIGSTELVVDGEVVAYAHVSDLAEPDGRWYVGLGKLLGFTVQDRRKAELILKWIGDKITPPLTVITGPEELDQAPVGSLWQSEYPANTAPATDIRNQYLRTADGWEWCGGDDEWISCDRPYVGAYPLTAVS